MLTQPPVPASTVTYTNPCGQTAYVTVAGGTVTHITVNGSDQATATNFTATVPAGGTIAITYSAAPAWYWSVFTPAVPATTVAAVNPTGRNLYVVLAGGTVTVVAVNGTTVASASPANVALPAGGSIAVTYSAAPAWAWLDWPWMAPPPSTGGVYMASNTVAPTGVAGYDPLNDLPYAGHAGLGEAGLAVGVSN